MVPSHDSREKSFRPPESPWYNTTQKIPKDDEPKKKAPTGKINLPPRPQKNVITVPIPFKKPKEKGEA